MISEKKEHDFEKKSTPFFIPGLVNLQSITYNRNCQ